MHTHSTPRVAHVVAAPDVVLTYSPHAGCMHGTQTISHAVSDVNACILAVPSHACCAHSPLKAVSAQVASHFSASANAEAQRLVLVRKDSPRRIGMSMSDATTRISLPQFAVQLMIVHAQTCQWQLGEQRIRLRNLQGSAETI